jgi:predicted acyl esterase
MLLMDDVIRAMYRDPSGEQHHLVPDRVERLTINLGHICHTIGAGHRIEVDVTSSNFHAAPATLSELRDDGISDASIAIASPRAHPRSVSRA